MPIIKYNTTKMTKASDTGFVITSIAHRLSISISIINVGNNLMVEKWFQLALKKL